MFDTLLCTALFLFFSFLNLSIEPGELNATIRSTAVRFEINFPRDTLHATSTLSIAIIGLDPLSGDPSTTEVRHPIFERVLI